MKKHLLSVLALVVFAVFALGTVDEDKKKGGGGSTTAAPAAEPPTKADEPAKTGAAKPAAPPAGELPFVVERSEFCEKYKAAPNQIKKSAVFNDYRKAAKAKRHAFKDVLGTVKDIKTPQGGGHVLFKVQVPFGEATNDGGLEYFGSTLYEIKKGTALYTKVGELKEGDQVKIGGANLVPSKNLFSEEQGVCGDT
ncbi:MAG: hypothetical protein HY906_01720 [Deltaproteobacteria bacterium]|nr:hypothetical protein [Deltaproteobacteria bacterium]